MPNMTTVFGYDIESPWFDELPYDISETPDSELANGIQSVSICTYGDSVDGKYVQVAAVSKERALAAYQAAHHVDLHMLYEIPGAVAKTDSPRTEDETS